MTELRVTFKNTSAPGGTALTPLFVGFHDDNFDLYNLGQASSPGLEALAEDGNNSIVAAEVVASDADAQTTNVVGDRGPVGAGETASTIIDVDAMSNAYASFATMILPSNDAFVGTANALLLFNADGEFIGESTSTFTGASVRDAGTEVNTERDAAFINQTGPNTGETENGVVTIHPGFNGSQGNPGGEQIILGGTNAFGEFIDPVAADFSIPGTPVAEVHINTVVRTNGTAGVDVFAGTGADDLVNSGAGNDLLSTGNGWDVVNAGAGNDVVRTGFGDDEISGGLGNDILFGEGGDDRVEGGGGQDTIFGGGGVDVISGGFGSDEVFGGNGNDQISGDAGDDALNGNGGSDSISGGSGEDTLNGGGGRDLLLGGNDDDVVSGGGGGDLIAGGAGDDRLTGGQGDDVFAFASGDGADQITDFDIASFRGDDTLLIDVAGIESFADVQAAASDSALGTTLDFGSDGSVLLLGVSSDALAADSFDFA